MKEFNHNAHDFANRTTRPVGSDVHVWHAPVSVSLMRREHFSQSLSEDEKLRAQRFRFEKDRIRFITARGLLREILASYMKVGHNEIRFHYTEFGKPRLNNDEGLTFNVSHSGELVLLAVARGREIGIDVEQIRHGVPVREIAERFFTQNEIRELQTAADAGETAMFFQYWTRKEALVKAVGEGISLPLEQCDVSLTSKPLLTTVVRSNGKRENHSWYVRDLSPNPGYASAVAAEGSDWNLSSFYTVDWDLGATSLKEG